MKKKHARNVPLLLTGMAVAMFAFGFALVPIYNSLCKNLGINGKVDLKPVAFDASKATVAQDREVLVEFVATNNSGVPWAFYPKTPKLKVHPGEIARLAFYAENKTNHLDTDLPKQVKTITLAYTLFDVTDRVTH